MSGEAITRGSAVQTPEAQSSGLWLLRKALLLVFLPMASGFLSALVGLGTNSPIAVKWGVSGTLVTTSFTVVIIQMFKARRLLGLEKSTKVGRSASVLARIAALIAGRKRVSALSLEWQSHLFGETGRGLPRTQQVRIASGFVGAAIRYRLQDAADLDGGRRTRSSARAKSRT